MKTLNVLLFLVLIIGELGHSQDFGPKDVVIENEQMRLSIGPEGKAKSLIHKPTNEECLMQGQEMPVFSITQYRPYDPGMQLAHSSKKTKFAADSVYRDGDKLVIGFENVDFEAIVDLNITPQYIQFSIENFRLKDRELLTRYLPKLRIDEMSLLQLPVRNRTHFGEWLNVLWDDQVAVNILGTDPYVRIDSEERDGYHILKADMVSEVKPKEVGAALITTSTNKLLDNIAQVEKNFDLPKGVKSRRHEKYNLSYYWSGSVNPGNIDKHVDYAQKAGFRIFVIYYRAFSKAPGHFTWRDEYPNGMEDLQMVVNKIENAGMIPGFHIHYNKAGKNDKYVTPVPDHRLNVRKHFTLSESLDKNDATIFVEENPRGITLEDGRRILKIGDELISYTDYSTTRPFKFTGCTRGALTTRASDHSISDKFGLLDIDSWPIFVRFDQNTSIQEEVGKKLARIYQEAGFKIIYFDGAEDVHKPYWFTVPLAQWKVYERLNPEPIFSEGAAKSHFSWHMLSRGNAYDPFRPENVKEATKKMPASDVRMMKENFTCLNFGWLGYQAPSDNTIGHQPDMYEYVTSRAAAWDCPISIQSSLGEFMIHTRTSDNLEVLRRWEEVRIQDWLTEDQKKMLRDLTQEHILLLNEQEEFELVPYDQINNVAKGKKEVRAFIFKRKGDFYVVYWHISGNKKLELPVSPENIALFEELGEKIEVQSGDYDNSVILPVSNRQYARINQLSRKQIITAFQNATILE